MSGVEFNPNVKSTYVPEDIKKNEKQDNINIDFKTKSNAVDNTSKPSIQSTTQLPDQGYELYRLGDQKIKYSEEAAGKTAHFHLYETETSIKGTVKHDANGNHVEHVQTTPNGVINTTRYDFIVGNNLKLEGQNYQTLGTTVVKTSTTTITPDGQKHEVQYDPKTGQLTSRTITYPDGRKVVMNSNSKTGERTRTFIDANGNVTKQTHSIPTQTGQTWVDIIKDKYGIDNPEDLQKATHQVKDNNDIKHNQAELPYTVHLPNELVIDGKTYKFKPADALT